MRGRRRPCNARRDDALSIAGFHSAVPADRGRDVLPGGAVPRAAAVGADRRLAGILRLVGRALHSAPARPDRPHLAAVGALRAQRPAWPLYLGVVINLASLATFKYLDFLVGIEAAIGLELPRAHVILPIGISFFSFQLISYLVDRMRKDAPLYPLRPFTLFVLLFPAPHRRADRAPQRARAAVRARPAPRRAVGARRLGLVDVHGRPRQEGADCGPARRLRRSALHPGAAAVARFRRSLDGGARLLVPALPRFLGLHRDGDRHRADVRPAAAGEFPLGPTSRPTCAISGGAGTSRCRSSCATISTFRSAAAAMASRATWWRRLLTMGLCGLWHGAGWTFVAWGLWHGVGLVVCRAWQQLARPLPAPAGWALTMLFVLVGMGDVPRRRFPTAASILCSLVGCGGFAGKTRDAGLIVVAALRRGAGAVGPRDQGHAPVAAAGDRGRAAALAGLLRARGRPRRAGQLHLLPVLRARWSRPPSTPHRSAPPRSEAATRDAPDQRGTQRVAAVCASLPRRVRRRGGDRRRLRQPRRPL